MEPEPEEAPLPESEEDRIKRGWSQSRVTIWGWCCMVETSTATQRNGI